MQANLTAAPATPEGQFVGRLINVLRDTWFDPAGFFNEAYLWDPTSAIVMLYPSVVVNFTTVPLHVVSVADAWDAPLQGATRICSAAQAKVAGYCARVTVAFQINGSAVSNILLALMQSPVNSAVRPLFCPGDVGAV